MTTTVIGLASAPKGWKTNPAYVQIFAQGKGDVGLFGNPYFQSPQEGAAAVVARYEGYLLSQAACDPVFRSAVLSLYGKTLVCTCRNQKEPDAPCHGDLLARMADSLRCDQIALESAIEANKRPERPERDWWAVRARAQRVKNLQDEQEVRRSAQQAEQMAKHIRPAPTETRVYACVDYCGRSVAAYGLTDPAFRRFKQWRAAYWKPVADYGKPKPKETP